MKDRERRVGASSWGRGWLRGLSEERHPFLAQDDWRGLDPGRSRGPFDLSDPRAIITGQAISAVCLFVVKKRGLNATVTP